MKTIIGRVECPICRRNVAVRPNGRVRAHPPSDGCLEKRTPWGQIWCAGSGVDPTGLRIMPSVGDRTPTGTWPPKSTQESQTMDVYTVEVFVDYEGGDCKWAGAGVTASAGEVKAREAADAITEGYDELHIYRWVDGNVCERWLRHRGAEGYRHSVLVDGNWRDL